MADAAETKQEEKTLELSVPLLLQSVEHKVVQELEYGFLRLLEGKWVNKDGQELGFNVIAMPAPGTQPDDKVGGGGKGGFVLVPFKYTETLIFTLNGSARNRGGLNEQLNAVVKYDQTVIGAQNGQEKPTVQHIEDGMFLYLNNISLNKGQAATSSDDEQYKPEFIYARSGTVPHGNSLMLFGNELDEVNGPPDLASIKDTTLNPISATMNLAGTEAGILGYTDAWWAMGTTPFDALNDVIKDQNIIKTRTISLSSKNSNGAVTDTSFIKKFANATQMDFILWIETVKDKDTGKEFVQLQYVQKIIIEFNRTEKTNTIIQWPHITVNTMVLDQ